MWRTKSQDARGGKAIPADFTRDVMLNKILGLSDFTIALSSSRPSSTSYTIGALLRSFGHVRLVAMAGALVVHCQEQRHAMGSILERGIEDC
jgi:hypothetical protein